MYTYIYIITITITMIMIVVIIVDVLDGDVVCYGYHYHWFILMCWLIVCFGSVIVLSSSVLVCLCVIMLFLCIASFLLDLPGVGLCSCCCSFIHVCIYGLSIVVSLYLSFVRPGSRRRRRTASSGGRPCPQRDQTIKTQETKKKINKIKMQIKENKRTLIYSTLKYKEH